MTDWSDINNWRSDAPAQIHPRTVNDITQQLLKGIETMTLEEYLKANSYPNKKTTDHALRMCMTDAGVTFYIHPQGVDGDTANFLVKGNSLSPDPYVAKAE